MGKRFIVIVLVLTIAASVAAQEDAISDEATIRQTIQYYVDGWRYNNLKNIRKALHPKARFYFQATTAKGGLAEITAERFFITVERNRLRREPKPFSSRIISIDATENVASAKLELDWHDVWLGGRNTSLLKPPPGAIETRYLSLIRFNDGWKIVSDISNVREGHNTTASRE
jgi:hypothetical protein